MGLNTLDLVVIGCYLAGVTLFGLRFRSGQQTLKGYFLADNAIPWWAISLSIVAAETSTLTVISVPGLAYDKDFSFLQLVIGYLIGRVVVSFVLIPQYFRGELVTAYQLIERRFGQRLRTLTAGVFLVTRAAAEGVRVFAVAIVVRVALGGLLTGVSDFERDLVAIAIVTVLTLLYTLKGGLKAAIWTDVMQQTVYVAGTIVGLVTILHLVPGGWATVREVAGQAGKFRVLDFTFDWTTKYTLWSGVIGGAFLTTASHGTDQLIVQRLLAARSEGQAKIALLSSGVVVLFQFSLFLMIGAMLYVFYRIFPPADCVYANRQGLSCFHREPHAARRERVADCRDIGGGDVEPERGAQFAFFHFDCRFLHAPSSAFVGDPAHLVVAGGDGGLGAGAVRVGAAGAARRQGDRSRVDDCLGRLWRNAGRVFVRRAHAPGLGERGHGGHDLWIGVKPLPLALHRRGVYVVRGAGQRGDVRRGLCRELRHGWKTGNEFESRDAKCKCVS